MEIQIALAVVVVIISVLVSIFLLWSVVIKNDKTNVIMIKYTENGKIDVADEQK